MLDIFAALEEPSEIDSYSVVLEAGVTYYLEIYGAPSGTGTHVDPTIRIFAPDGAELGYDDDGGVGYETRLIFTPTETLTYRLDVEAYSSNQVGTYRLTVFPDDYRASVEGNGRLGEAQPGGNVAGTIDYTGAATGLGGDADLFAVNLIGGLSYDVSLRGLSTGDGTLDRGLLECVTFNGVVLDSDQAGAGETADLTILAGISGPQYLRVGEGEPEAGGTYVIYVSAGYGTDGDDVVTALATADAIDGRSGNDLIDGRGGNDTLSGEDGDDRLRGGTELDDLSGDAGSDTLRGEFGDDVLNGGAGSAGLIGDRLFGGEGNDVFVFLAVTDSSTDVSDVIGAGNRGTGTAFDGAGDAAGDLIDLSAIDGDTGTDGRQALVFDGSEGTGNVWLRENGTNTVILANTDADGNAEFRLVIRDGAVMFTDYTGADFIL